MAVILAAILLEVVGQCAFKLGAVALERRPSPAGWLRGAVRTVTDPWVAFGLAAHVVELFLWIAALHLAPLSVAFPLMSLSYCGVAAAGHFWLGEPIGRRGLVAIGLVTAGAILVSGVAG